MSSICFSVFTTSCKKRGPLLSLEPAEVSPLKKDKGGNQGSGPVVNENNNTAPKEAVVPDCTRASSGALDNTILSEISGIDRSAIYPGQFYVHNDSGGASAIYRIRQDGRFVASVELTNATANDWEDIATGPCGDEACIYVADFGNKTADRKSFDLYTLVEGETSPTATSFRYPNDSSYDAGALAVNPQNGEKFVIRKTTGNANTLYEFPEGTGGNGPITLREICTFDDLGSQQVTGADIHDSGTKILIRTYSHVYEYFASEADSPSICGNQVRKISHDEPQGESIAYINDGHSFVTLSEGTNSLIHEFSCEL